MTYITALYPEIFLSIAIFIQLVWNIQQVIKISKNNFPIVDVEAFYQTLFIFFCTIILVWDTKIESFDPALLLIISKGTQTYKLFFLSACLFILPLVFRGFVAENLNFYEYFVLLSIYIFGSLFLFSANNLLVVFLALEIQAFVLYTLTCFNRESAFGSEAALKYFISGAFSTGFFLLGCVFIYASIGSLDFTVLNSVLIWPFDDKFKFLEALLLAGILLINFTLLFKISSAPFHSWAADVYDGAPLASTVIFSILPKIAILGFFIKWISVCAPVWYTFKNIFLFLSILTVVIGTFSALAQKRVKRLLVFSSIGQVGFMVACLGSVSLNTLTALIFFIFIYVLTSTLIWGHLSLFYFFKQQAEMIFPGVHLNSIFLTDLSNLVKRNRFWSFSFALAFMSLAGLPPLIGFLSKALILFSLVSESNIMEIPILLMLMALFSTYYYIRVVRLIIFEPEVNHKLKTVSSYACNRLDLDYTILSFITVFLLISFFYPTPFLLVGQYIVTVLI